MGEAFTKDRKSSACCRVGAMFATERAWARAKVAIAMEERCGEALRSRAAAGIQARR